MDRPTTGYLQASLFQQRFRQASETGMKKQRLAILVFNRLLVPQNVSWQHGNTARAMMHGHVLNVARHISLSFAFIWVKGS